MISSIGSMNLSIMDDMQLNNVKTNRTKGEKPDLLGKIGIGKKPESDDDYQMLIDKLTANKETNSVAEKIFNVLDEDQDGQLTVDEVKNGKPQGGRPGLSGPPPMPGTGGMDRAMFDFIQSGNSGSTEESDASADPDDLNLDGIVDMTEMLQALMKEKQSVAAKAYDSYSLMAS